MIIHFNWNFLPIIIASLKKHSPFYSYPRKHGVLTDTKFMLNKLYLLPIVLSFLPNLDPISLSCPSPYPPPIFPTLFIIYNLVDLGPERAISRTYP